MEAKKTYSPEELIPFQAIHPGEMLKDERLRCSEHFTFLRLFRELMR